jgi:thiamine-monophosphate kinase
LVKRSGAQVGDLVAVTGTLGNSGAGLDLLINGDWEKYDFALPLVTAHLTPRPQVRMGHNLALFGATSMDDISDGLASEANEIASASQVGIEIYAASVPLSPEIRRATQITDKQALNYALYGGEDYQLIFTISPERFRELAERNMGVALTAIGKVVSTQTEVILVQEDGQRRKLEPRGYNHFR